MRPRVQAIVDDLLDDVQAAGRMDLIADLAFPLPYHCHLRDARRASRRPRTIQGVDTRSGPESRSDCYARNYGGSGSGHRRVCGLLSCHSSPLVAKIHKTIY